METVVRTFRSAHELSDPSGTAGLKTRTTGAADS